MANVALKKNTPAELLRAIYKKRVCWLMLSSGPVRCAFQNINFSERCVVLPEISQLDTCC